MLGLHVHKDLYKLKTEHKSQRFMKTILHDTAHSGQNESLDLILTRIQRMHVPNRYILMSEHWDWLVVLQCLQDHNLFRSNPKRPPLSAFAAWVKQQNITQLLAHCSMREMSLANTGIRGARYPWAHVAWEPHVLERWRVLYQTLDKLLNEMEQSTHTMCNFVIM